MLHQIGVGALGPVYRTYEPTRDRLVAVKVFRLDLTPEQASSLADELRKATEAGLFHPSIVEPVAAGLEGTVAYRAEEYVAAESLDVAMRHYAPAPLEKALPFIAQLAAAIDAARAAGVGHGALHPRDIFVTPDEARATGFGVVDALDRLGIRAPVRRPYSAPERIAGQSWSTRADVFSLGAIAFELLTGRRPSGLGDQMGSLAGASLGSHADAVHGVLARAMHEDPAERFESADAFASALQEAGGVEAAASPKEAAASGATVETALDDFAAESTPTTLGDSPREAARRAIAARKRQAKPKPKAEPASPSALFEDSRKDEPKPFEAEAEAVIAAAQEAEAAAAIASDRPAATEANVNDDVALAHDIIANEEPVASDRGIERDDAFAARPADTTSHDVPVRAPERDLTPETAPIASALREEPSEDIVEPADVAVPLALDAHDAQDRVVAVDEFRARDTVSARDASAPRVERSWPRATERPASPPERLIAPPVKAPIDPMYSDIPYVPVDEPLPDRPRAAMLPYAIVLILGLVLGYMAGYVVGTREQAQEANGARNTPAGGSAPSTPASSFSEGTVTPTTGRPSAPATPSDAATVPSDAAKPVASGAKPTPPDASRAAVGAKSSPAAARPTAPAPAAKSTPGTGKIVITSTPSKASVTLNGKWIGRTPVTIERPFGKYAVRVVQPGYDVATDTVTLSSAASSRTVDATLTAKSTPRSKDAAPAAPRPTAPAAPRTAAPAQAKPQAGGTGEIFIDSRPQGARVFIDGKPQGVTPLRVANQSVGSHEVRLELADHQTWTTTTRVVAGTTVRVTGSLDRLLVR